MRLPVVYTEAARAPGQRAPAAPRVVVLVFSRIDAPAKFQVFLRSGGARAELGRPASFATGGPARFLLDAEHALASLGGADQTPADLRVEIVAEARPDAVDKDPVGLLECALLDDLSAHGTSSRAAGAERLYVPQPS